MAQCTAIAASTGKRCQNAPVDGSDTCSLHAKKPARRKPRMSKEQALPKLVATLEQGALVEEACKAAGCSTTAFYRWQHEDGDFRDAIAHAKEVFACNVDEEIQNRANKRILELLTVGHEITETVVKYAYDENGKWVPVSKEVKTTNMGTPNHIWDKLLPDSLAEKAASMIVQLSQQANNQFNQAA